MTEFWFAMIYLGPPVVLGVTWRVWFRRERAVSPQWRAVAIRLGLLAATANVVIFYTWVLYRVLAGSSPRVWEAKDVATEVAGWFIMAALAGAALGKGAGRIWLAFSAFTGFMLWIRIGIL